LEEVEYAVALCQPEAVQQLSGAQGDAESLSGMIGRITRDAKHAGKRSAGNSHAPFDAAGAGNVAWSRSCDTRRRKSERTGNTNFDLHQRASPRPYCRVRSVASACRAQNADRSGERGDEHAPM